MPPALVETPPPPERKTRYAGGRHATDPLVVGTSTGDQLQTKLRELRTKSNTFHAATATDRLIATPGVACISAAIRYLDGGRIRFMEFVQYAAQNGNDPALRFWSIYADLQPHERVSVALDDIAWAANVRPADLMSAVVGAAMQHSIDVANLIAASMHPDIVRQAGKSAKRIGGQHAEIAFKDRLLMLQHAGLAAIPKGQTTSVHVHNTASASAEAAAASKSDSSVPTFADDMAAIDGAVLGAHRLPAARTPTLAGDFVDDARFERGDIFETSKIPAGGGSH